ncbi:MAG: BamA/OMP85 family outer membrane protein [Planctomycetota bacterium]|jgi:outer membrane protein insertion porin family
MKNSHPVALVPIALLILGAAHAEDKATEQVLGRYAVGSINFEFADSRTFKKKRLSKLLGFKKGDSVDSVQVRFGREDLENFYRKKGFAFVEVMWNKQALAEGSVVYSINEGPRVRIKSVRLSGNKALKTRTLKKAIKSHKKRWFLWSRYYSEEQVSRDVERLEDAYWERGFLDYNVRLEKQFSENKKWVRITFVIDEGPIYTVEEVILTGAEKIYNIGEGFSEERLRGDLALEPGQTYRKRKAESDRERLLKHYREHGFVNARVDLQTERVLEPAVEKGDQYVSRGRVNVEFEIHEGRQFRIGRLDITGNEKTQDRAIRRILDGYEFQPGRYYDADAAPLEGGGELERRMQSMLLAEEVTITPLASNDPNRKDVEVHIKEGQTGMVMVGGAIGADTGLMGQLAYEERNFNINDWPASFGEFVTGRAFKGAGQSLTVALQPGTELSQNVISFREPYFRDKPVALSVRGSDLEWGRESYDENKLKGYFGFEQRHEIRNRDQWRKSIGFRTETVDVDNIDFDAPEEIWDVEGDNLLLGVKFGIAKDLTDRMHNPGKGYRLESNYEQVAGDYTFGVLGGTWWQYRTLHEDLGEQRTILTTKLHAATIIGDAPPFERFYAGGMGTYYGVRGFEYRGISTRGLQTNVASPRRKDPIGSDWIFLASTEVVVPLVTENFSTLFFIDSGTIDSGSYRAAAGGGLQILIPQWFGPVPMRFGVGKLF